MARNITVNTNLVMAVLVRSLVITINAKLVTLQLEKMVRKVLIHRLVKIVMASNITVNTNLVMAVI